MRPFVPFVLGVAGCVPLVAGCAYKPGSFSHSTSSFTGQQATVGCLDISVERKPDEGDWPVLDYSFGNRCDRVTPVDLAWTQVIGRTADGAEVALIPYDPKSELRVLKLDGLSAGREALAYPTRVSLGQVCVDVASIAQQKPAQWICFGNVQPVAMLEPAMAVAIADER